MTREHFIFQEDPDTQTCSPNSAVAGYELRYKVRLGIQRCGKRRMDLEFPFSLPEGPSQSYPTVKERVARVVKKINMKIF